MKVFIDIDGVLVNFVKQYAKFYEIDKGIHIDYSTVEDYDLMNTFKTEYKYKYLYAESFYDDIEFMPNAVECINKLNNSDDINIHFLTSCVTQESLFAKYKLLRRTFNWFRPWHFMSVGYKWMIECDDGVFIDDCPSNLEKSKMPVRICYELPHNKHVRDKVDFSSSNWNSIVNFILKGGNHARKI